MIKRFFDGWQGYDIEISKAFDRVLLIEDGAHTYADTIGAMEKFETIIKKDSYMIIEDGIVDKLGWGKKYKGGPQKAIRQFLINNNRFVIDRNLCDFYGTNSTFNVNGYLKCIK